MDINQLLASFASAFSQDNRHITLAIDSDTAGPEQLLPQTLDGEEGVSRP
ncbi:hypothetical protein [Chromobacterium violaceum]|uniref:Uncharacterized protein n=1 Tax=Chromobacterium violaceum TaxID=536 RepID=A0AAX2M3K9_CHRVL|nr:hypothetical protein [Chromobacterium violaceum]STB69109.1 Uncharacterised protein [Chromobacterium violaceum]SUX31055.1 Uncharacterised protein [Chromobacterium violaceum]